jgi:hypothetical protein
VKNDYGTELRGQGPGWAGRAIEEKSRNRLFSLQVQKVFQTDAILNP